MDEITERVFKKIKIDSSRTIYFICSERELFLDDRIVSATLDFKGFILKAGEEYYYYGDDFSEELIEKFVFENLTQEEEYPHCQH